jgi:hypothetical protein
MPHNLTDDNTTYSTPVVSPSNGDDVDVDIGVKPGLQVLANRTAYLKRAVDFLDPNLTGARQLYQAASYSALRAISTVGLPNGTFCVLQDYGLYRYNSGSAATELLPQRVAPNSGVGRWFWQGYNTLDTANGVPSLDSTSRLALSQMRGALVASGFSHKTTTDNVTGSAAVPGLTPIAVSVAVGDIVLADGSCEVALDEVGMSEAVMSVRRTVVAADATFSGRVRQQANASSDASVFYTLHHSDRAVVTTGGTLTLSLYLEPTFRAGSVGWNTYYANLRVQVFRP